MIALLSLAVALTNGLPAANPKLDAGKALYANGDYKASLKVFLAALRLKSTKNETATTRMYIGLVQLRYKHPDSARGNFKQALTLNPNLRLPSARPQGTLTLWNQVKKELGIASRRTRTRSRTKPARDRTAKRKATNQKPPPDVEILQPMTPGTTKSESTASVRRRERPELTTATPEPVTITSKGGVPTAGWVAGGIGAGALVAGVVLAVLSGINGQNALEQTDKERAISLHDSANVQHKAGLVSFGAAGLAFGVAALTVTFD